MTKLELVPGCAYKARELGDHVMHDVVCVKADECEATIRFEDGGMVTIGPWSEVARERDVLVFY